MIQFQAHIVDNGNKDRFYTLETLSGGFKYAAQEIAKRAHVQNGGHVVVAEMDFDYPSHKFVVTAYEFDVISGKVENLKPVK